MARKLQQVFKNTYIERLRKHIDVENYKGLSFPYDKEQVKYLANVYQPEDLNDKLINALADSYKQAILLYEAYPNLTPLVATQASFWTYLTHVDLFGYCQKRWPNIDSEEYIDDHWFRSRNGVMRTTLMGLWWSVYCSVDESLGPDHKYDYTRILFDREDFRTRRLGGSTLMRHREAVLGILKFIKDYQSMMDEYFEGRAIFIAKYFNSLGGTMQLAYMNRDFFYDELVKHLPEIKTINERKNILNSRE